MFVTVANGVVDVEQVRTGNEAVLRARYEEAIVLHTGGQGDECTDSAGKKAPGNFGYIEDGSAACPVVTQVNSTIGGDTGNALTRQCDTSYMTGLIGTVVFLPVFAVVWLLERELRSEREDEVMGLVVRQTQQANSEMERLIEGNRTLLTAIAAAPSVREFAQDRCSRYLGSLAGSLPHLHAILVLDLAGDPRCTDDPSRSTANYADRPYFRAALQSGGFVVGQYTLGRVEPSQILPMASVIRNEAGIAIGVAVVGLRLSHLQSIVGAWGLPENGSLTIADSEGTILARNPAPERFVGARIPEDFVTRWVRARSPGVEEVQSQDGTWRIIAYQPASVSPAGVYVSSGFARDEAFVAADSNWLWNLAVLAAGLLGAVVMSFVAAETLIRRPVNDLVGLAHAWSRREPAKVSRPIATTEFETVAASLDKMGMAMEERSRTAAKQQELLVAELHHRVKNLLGMVQAIGVQTATSVGAPREFNARFTERIQALSRTTEMLTVRQWEGLNLRDILQAEMDATPRSEAAELQGPDLSLPPQLAMPVTLIAHELATNAVKYGCLSQPDGRLAVAWTVAGECGREVLNLEWRERCPQPVSPGTGTGFGSKLIRRLLASVGTGGSQFENGGLVFSMRVELDQFQKAV